MERYEKYVCLANDREIAIDDRQSICTANVSSCNLERASYLHNKIIQQLHSDRERCASIRRLSIVVSNNFIACLTDIIARRNVFVRTDR